MNPVAPRRRQNERLLWLGVAALVVTMQWPMLKGWYYRTVGSASPASTIQWRTDYDAALEEARQTGRPVLIDFNADWCPPCIVMKHDVWPDRDVSAAIAEGFIPLLVDMDRDQRVSALYDITAIPTILMVDGTGQEMRRAGYLPVSGMMRFLREDGR